MALHKDMLSSTGTASFTAEVDGRYTYCFSNEMSTLADKLVRYVDLACRVYIFIGNN